MSHSTSLFHWLLEPLQAPTVQELLTEAGWLSQALKLSLKELIQLHLATQLGGYESWPDVTSRIGNTPGAQETVLPSCPPLHADERDRRYLRKQVAEVKKLPPEKRWAEVTALLQRLEQQPQIPASLQPTDPISTSQLTRSNRRIPSAFWKKLIDAVLAEITPAIGPAELPTVGPVRAIDATTFSLPPSAQWATFRDASKAVKVLADYDVVTALVKAPLLTTGVVHEAKAVRKLPRDPGVTYLWDRGFLDFAEYDQLCRRGVYFVTRCKDNTVIAPLNSYSLPADSNVMADQEVVLGGGTSRMEHSLRLVTVQMDDGTCFRLITNRFDLPAETIAKLYRLRWHIELFFRWLKHHFKTLRFFGRSEPAVYAQIAAAFLAHMLLLYRYRQLGYRGGLLKFSRHVAARLFAPVDSAWVRAVA